MNLSSGQLNILRLTAKEQEKHEDGWAHVSRVVWPMLADIPVELLRRVQEPDGGGWASLTDAGNIVIRYS